MNPKLRETMTTALSAAHTEDARQAAPATAVRTAAPPLAAEKPETTASTELPPLAEAATQQPGEASPARELARAPSPAYGPAGLPSVGRAVHFHDEGGPYAATVTAVNADGTTVALVTFGRRSMYFHQAVPYSETPRQGHWSWAPRA